jgi:GNAT superfamily N-acetyltransferase
MQIAYEIDKDDYADASIAASIPRSKQRGLSGRPLLPPWVLWALVGTVLAFVTILYLVIVFGRDGGASEPTEPAGVRLLNLVARYEWFLPWLVLALATYVSMSSRHGRRIYRAASLANMIVLFVLLALMLAAGRWATEPSPLADYGILQFVPWGLLISHVYNAFAVAWLHDRFKAAYQNSWYAGGARVITFDEEQVRDEGERMGFRYQWSVLSRVETTARLLLLFNKGGQLISFVPRRAIGNADQVNGLVETIQSRLDGSRAFAVVTHEVAPATIAPPENEQTRLASTMNSSTKANLVVSRVPPHAVLDLRHRVLRQGLPPESAVFEGDDEPTAIHLGAFDGSTMVGCVSLLQREWKGEPAWQMRGMAVDESMRGTGVGAALLDEVDRIVSASTFSKLNWCNARLVAKGFYERHGWTVESELFDIPTAGPHHKMSKRLP